LPKEIIIPTVTLTEGVPVSSPGSQRFKNTPINRIEIEIAQADKELPLKTKILDLIVELRVKNEWRAIWILHWWSIGLGFPARHYEDPVIIPGRIIKIADDPGRSNIDNTRYRLTGILHAGGTMDVQVSIEDL